MFVFGITGTGPLAVSDFTEVLSVVDDGESASVVAARFVDGGQSAIGANHMPEPGTGLLLGFGLVAISILRRRS